MKLFKLFTFFLGIIIFCGCATPYQSDGFGGGYSEFRITRDTFVVTFRGNSFTPSQKVLEYTLMRASELTVQNGYTYFSVIDSQDTTKKKLVSKTTNEKKSDLVDNIFDLSLKERATSETSVSEVIYPSMTMNIKCYCEKPYDVEVINAVEYLMFNRG